MHICFIEDTRLHGGTQIWVTEAARAFIAAGADVTVLTPADGWVAPRCRALGAAIVDYDFDDVVTEDEKNRRIWATALENAQVAVCTVHPPRRGFHCSVFASRVIKAFGLDTILIPKTGTIVPEYLREFYLPDETLASRVITITDFTRRYLENTYKIPPAGIELIYQGTDIGLFTPRQDRKAEAANRYPLPSGASPVLGYAGSFEERKGLPVLLKAVAKAKKVLPDIHLVLVGDGPDEALLKEMAGAMGLTDHVSFFPFTSEPVYMFECVDMVVLSSLRKEGLPNILLEAMAMGLPVVASRMAGIPEIVVPGETGYMVAPGDVDDFAGAIVNLWSDAPQYQRMADKARGLMASRFDKKKQFTAFLNFFKTLIAEKAGPR